MKKKVIIRLQGGLGNQLHQYAYGLLLAKKIDADLYFDKEFLTDHSKKLNITLRDLEIIKFKINARFYKSILSNQIVLSLLKRLKLNNIFNFFKINIISNYTPLESLGNEGINFYYLDGIMGNIVDYQNDKAYLLENLKISDDYIALKNLAKSNITESKSVAIHIRRTDYLKAGSIHHVLEMDYYKRAMDYIESKLKNPTYYVFSDDKQFVKENFSGSTIQILDYVEKDVAFFDFLAIESCQHYIIANSTFSWWAAYLGNTSESMTVAPSVCLTIQELDLKITYPKNWIVF
jgi:hypothetical protein